MVGSLQQLMTVITSSDTVDTSASSQPVCEPPRFVTKQCVCSLASQLDVVIEQG